MFTKRALTDEGDNDDDDDLRHMKTKSGYISMVNRKEHRVFSDI